MAKKENIDESTMNHLIDYMSKVDEEYNFESTGDGVVPREYEQTLLLLKFKTQVIHIDGLMDNVIATLRSMFMPTINTDNNVKNHYHLALNLLLDKVQDAESALNHLIAEVERRSKKDTDDSISSSLEEV